MSDPCLTCTLFQCDEKDRRCAFNRDRTDYFAAYYRYNKTAKLAAANERNARLRAEKEAMLTKHQRYHRRHKAQRQAAAREYQQSDRYKEWNRERMAAKRAENG